MTAQVQVVRLHFAQPAVRFRVEMFTVSGKSRRNRDQQQKWSDLIAQSAAETPSEVEQSDQKEGLGNLKKQKSFWNTGEHPGACQSSWNK